MENNDFLIVSCERKSLSNGTRIYNSIYGLIVIIFCMINYHLQWLPLIIIGILSIIYGLIGKELFKTKNTITITQNAILIKRSFERNMIIDLKDVKRIVFDLYVMQINFIDYVKTYDLSWLSSVEYHKLKEKLDTFNK